MLFDSAAFLFFFFPVIFALQRLVSGTRGKNLLLTAAGLVFYAFGSLAGLLLLLVSFALCYLCGLAVKKNRAPKAVTAVGVALELGMLVVFKYLNFTLGLFGVSAIAGLAAPAGISFFTFKCVSYLIDACRSGPGEPDRPLDVLLYLSFFPQLLAGPITRFGSFSAQLAERECTVRDMARGLRRLIVGLAKKLLIAGVLDGAVAAAFSPDAPPDVRMAWLGAAAYTLQIYFDFSGYSDIAIGLGGMFGFTTPENFEHPYVSASITEFWRRWHISLSLWFRDYLYIPLGGNRKGRVRTAVNKFAVFIACGAWHGANTTFLLWGAWHGLLSALESAGVINVKALQKTAPGRALSHIYALLAVCLGFVMFRADSPAAAMLVYGGMFGAVPVTAATTLALQSAFTPAVIAAMVLGVVFCLPVGEMLERRAATLSAKTRAGLETASYVGAAVLFAVCLCAMASGGFAPFIYFQF